MSEAGGIGATAWGRGTHSALPGPPGIAETVDLL